MNPRFLITLCFIFVFYAADITTAYASGKSNSIQVQPNCILKKLALWGVKDAEFQMGDFYFDQKKI